MLMKIFALKKFKIPTFSWMDTRFIRRFHEFEFLYKSNYTSISPRSWDRNPSFSPLLKISQ